MLINTDNGRVTYVDSKRQKLTHVSLNNQTSKQEDPELYEKLRQAKDIIMQSGV
jgi:hypothetical protein